MRKGAPLFLRLPAEDQTPLSWSNGLSSSQSGNWTEAATAALHHRVIAIAPATELLLTQVDLPGLSRRKVEQVMAYQLEEQIAGQVEENHFALGPRQSDGSWPVAVIQKKRMEEWLHPLRELAISPERLIPEPLLLPWEAGCWSLLLDDHHILVRTGSQSGFAVDPANGDFVLELALAHSRTGIQAPGEPQRLLVWDFTRQGDQRPAPLNDPARQVVWQRGVGDSLAFLASQPIAREGMDLLQGEFSRQARWLAMVRPFGLAALLLTGWLLLQGVTAVLEQQRLEQEILTLDRQIRQIVQETFPEIRNVVSPGVQMERQLAQLRRTTGTGAEGFLPLLEESGRLIRENNSATVERIRYQDGKLDLTIRLGDFQQLDRLKQRLLRLPTLTATLQSATKREGNGVESLVRIVRKE